MTYLDCNFFASDQKMGFSAATAKNSAKGMG